jgi:hypothetical protein
MMQAPEDCSCNHAGLGRQSVSMGMEWRGEGGRRLRNAWSQAHMGPADVIMLHPLLQHRSQVILSHGYQEIETFSP